MREAYVVLQHRRDLLSTDGRAVSQAEWWWSQVANPAWIPGLGPSAEESFLLRSYLDIHWIDECGWRESLVESWNSAWQQVEEGWDIQSRAGRFDSMIWSTIRYPALIPQVWLNWLHAAPEQLLKTLEEGRASRVDFVAFADGDRHVVEIDGPSHWAWFNTSTRSYTADEKEYARNLRIERWLRAEGWVMTRIGRDEVREAMNADSEIFGPLKLVSILPFGATAYPEQPTLQMLGLSALELYDFVLNDQISV